jgi:hypothetical protein
MGLVTARVAVTAGELVLGSSKMEFYTYIADKV